MLNKWTITALLIVMTCFLFTASCSRKVVSTAPEVSISEAEARAAEQMAAAEARAAAKRAAAEQAAAEKADAEAKLAEEAAAAERTAREFFMNVDIYFAFDSSVLSPEAQHILKSKALWLKNHSGFSAIIEGHCDERGTTEYNIALGDRRAESTRSFLLDYGISGERLTTISYGEERPADSGHNTKAWTLNRRAHFVIE